MWVGLLSREVVYLFMFVFLLRKWNLQSDHFLMELEKYLLICNSWLFRAVQQLSLHYSKYNLSIILLAHETGYQLNSFIWIAAVTNVNKPKYCCIVWKVKKITSKPDNFTSWSYSGLIWESNASADYNTQLF